MKKIYLVGLAFALLTASCDDVLEKTSSTQLPTICLLYTSDAADEL